jgi:glycosyltransferase involved in cell wall biosynthesis
MNVSFVVHRIYPPYVGGDEVQIMKTAEGLSKRGVDVAIFSADYRQGLERQTFYKGVELNRFPSFGRYYISPRLLNCLCNKRNGIIHSSTYGHFPTLAATVCKAKNDQIKYVLQPHYHGAGRNLLNNLVMRVYNPLVGKRIFEKADKIRCLSEGEKALVVNDFGVSPSKISVIPFGLDVDKLRIFKNRFRREEKEHRILYVGQLENFKGVHLLIRAFAQLLKIFNEKATLRIIGNGSQKGSLTKLVMDLKIQDHVTFKANLTEEDLCREYCEASLFVLLSKLESYSIVVREALFFELPVIVLQNRVFEDLAKNGNCFEVSSQAGPKEIALKMLKCLRKDLQPKIFRVPALNETIETLITLYDNVG